MIKLGGCGRRERAENRRATGIASRYPPEGWRGEKPMAACEWRLVGRQFGRIAAVSQLFSVLLFPQLFSTLHCASRSVPADALPVYRLSDRFRSPPCVHGHPSTRKRAFAIRRTFRYYRFSVDERSGNDGRADHRKKHPSISSPYVPSGSYEKK